MMRQLFGVAFLSASSAVAAHAQTAPTNQELDQRLRGVEQNVQTILDLLRQQQGASQSTSASQAGAPALRAGMTLGVCPLQPKQGGGLPDNCTGMPALSAHVPAPEEFSFEDAFKNAEMAQFGRLGYGGMLGMQWSGVLRVTQSGKHTFQANIHFSGQTAGATDGGCRAVLRLNDKTVVHAAGNFSWTGSKPNSYTEQASENLSPGFYKISVFVSCVFDRNPEYHIRQVGARITLAEPGDTALKPLPVDRIGVRQ